MEVLFLLLALVFAPPQIVVKWADPHSSETIAISVQGLDEMTTRCKRSGLEVRYRFEVRYCEEASWWADSCEDSRLILHSMQFDPISQTYRLTDDRLGDEAPPVVETIENEDEAIQRLSSIARLDLGFLSEEAVAVPISPRAYVGVRLLTQCKGVQNETLERLSYFLTLGMVRTSGFDSGWVSFRLAQSPPT